MRLFVIVNSALSAGLKAAQGIHAFRAFIEAYPEQEHQWFTESNNIVVLQDEDIPELASRLENHGLKLARFNEPDRDNELTAICVEPAAQRQLSNLPLAC